MTSTDERGRQGLELDDEDDDDDDDDDDIASGDRKLPKSASKPRVVQSADRHRHP